jgi:hypothetical protein
MVINTQKSQILGKWGENLQRTKRYGTEYS